MPRRPILYEVNVRCWLREISAREGRAVTLANVPAGEIEAWRARGFTHVWLMGVWTLGSRARRVYLEAPGTRDHLARLLPDWTEDDVPGSPYAVAAYRVSERLGGDEALEVFRQRLHRAGLRLILDFVPNHVGLDHAWVTRHPGWLVNSREEVPGTFRQDTVDGPRWIAHGRDPYFPPWSDTAQVDLRVPEARHGLIETLREIASKCDGVRCDMAMLGLTEVFGRTWKDFSSGHPPPDREFWKVAIEAVGRPDFLFIAEAYWDLEERLLELGFDLVYDKRVLDCLVDRRPDTLADHLATRGDSLVGRGLHFLENHDEPRIAGRLGLREHELAAILLFALPGVPLLHEGQVDGARLHASVHLSRRPVEAPDPEVRACYDRILDLVRNSSVGDGTGELLRVESIAGPADRRLPVVAALWRSGADRFVLILINPGPGEERVRIPGLLPAHEAGDWRCVDRLVTEREVAFHLGKGGGGTAGEWSLAGMAARWLDFSRAG